MPTVFWRQGEKWIAADIPADQRQTLSRICENLRHAGPTDMGTPPRLSVTERMAERDDRNERWKADRAAESRREAAAQQELSEKAREATLRGPFG